jgi:hypothetical protein
LHHAVSSRGQWICCFAVHRDQFLTAATNGHAGDVIALVAEGADIEYKNWVHGLFLFFAVMSETVVRAYVVHCACVCCIFMLKVTKA